MNKNLDMTLEILLILEIEKAHCFALQSTQKKRALGYQYFASS